MELLPGAWRTARASLVIATEADVDAIAGIFAGNEPLLSLLEPDLDPLVKAEAVVRHTSLPPEGSAEREQTYVIGIEGSDRTEGVLTTYAGHPTEETLYIGELFLHPRRQGRGLGEEIARGTEREGARAGFREIRLAVGLLNWGALRFWHRLGYDRVTKISGAPRFEPGAAGIIELARPLSRP
jgi:ribosomal protein S18 acetylase RimI-like enzyme